MDEKDESEDEYSEDLYTSVKRGRPSKKDKDSKKMKKRDKIRNRKEEGNDEEPR
jgi:hypothetical protein